MKKKKVTVKSKVKSKEKPKRGKPLSKQAEKAKNRRAEADKNIFVQPIQILRGYQPKEPSERLIKTIALLIKSGNFPETACRAVGVGKQTYNRWLEKGAADIEQGLLTAYSAFLLTIDAVSAQSECIQVSFISNRVHNWQALAWMLERQHKRWGQKVAHTLAGEADGAPIKTEDTTPIDTNYAGKLLAILEATVGLDALRDKVAEAEEAAESVATEAKHK
jgi:hypothetical protein